MFESGTFATKYIIEAQLGAGAYGKVFLAVEKTDTTKRVALKLFEIGQLTSKSVVRELSLVNSYSVNKYLKRILCSGIEPGGAPWVAYECLDYDLVQYQRKFLTGNPHRQYRLVRSIVYQLLMGLAGLHASGLCHRDVKPANIFVQGVEFPLIKLGDFGALRSMMYQDIERIQYTYEVGTRAYNSPEMRVGGGYGAAVDIYGVGLVMAELLTGRRMLPGNSDLEDLAIQLKLGGLTFVDACSRGIIGEELASSEELRQSFDSSRDPFPELNQSTEIICDAASDLIRGLLTFDRCERLTAKQGLLHRYFSGLDTMVFL